MRIGPNPRKLWRRYVIAVGLILVFVSGHFVASEWAAHSSEGSAHAINISGRQRMLSQRITLFAGEVMKDGEQRIRYTPLLLESVAAFERSHAALTKGGDLGLTGRLTADLRAIYFADGRDALSDVGLDAAVQAFIQDARLVAAGGAPAEAAWARLWSAGSSRLLTQLNDAVNAYEKDAVALVDRLRLIGAVSFVLAIAVLLGEVLLIFWPAHRTIVAAVDGLEAANARTSRALDTAQKAQRDAEAAQERAEHEAQVKTRFLATMSHEIRTPLNGVIGMLDLTLRRDMDDEQRERLVTAHESAMSLLKILNDTLDFSKLEAGQVQTETVPLCPSHIVNRVVSLFRAKADERGLSLTADVSPNVPLWVAGDPTRIRQILMNLVGNALKFTETGGVTIRVEPAGGAGAPTMRFEIEDTGIGIPEAGQAKLFNPFVQADASTTRKFGGTGLGLAICKQLVELMGGRIGVQSAVGVGSVFWFTAPGEPVDAPAAQTPAEPDQLSAIGPLRILIAEDNAVNQTIISEYVSALGHHMTMVGNGREALEALDVQRFDLILMDVQMPEMDGVQAAQAIRARTTPDKDIPIVALTANAVSGDREHYLQVGMSDYVSKPIDVRLLVAAIARAAGVAMDESAASSAAEDEDDPWDDDAADALFDALGLDDDDAGEDNTGEDNPGEDNPGEDDADDVTERAS